MKNSYYLVILSVAAFAASSCNTFIGAGRDIQRLGSGMQKAGYSKEQNVPPAPATTAPATDIVPAPQPAQ